MKDDGNEARGELPTDGRGRAPGPKFTTPSIPSDRGISRTSVIGKAKENVGILAAAERFCGKGVRRGQEVYFHCCLHNDQDPSLRVNSEKGLWFCDPSLVGGDVGGTRSPCLGLFEGGSRHSCRFAAHGVWS